MKQLMNKIKAELFLFKWWIKIKLMNKKELQKLTKHLNKILGRK